MSNLQATLRTIDAGFGQGNLGKAQTLTFESFDAFAREVIRRGTKYPPAPAGLEAEAFKEYKKHAPFFCHPVDGDTKDDAHRLPTRLIFADIDGCPKTAKPQIFDVCGGLSVLIYETASSTEATPRLRVIAEANRLILPEETPAVAQAFAKFFYSKIPALADWRSPEGERA